MNRRSLFKGAFASFFAFVGAKALPKPKASDEEVQRLAKAILNEHLDQLTLSLHKPIVCRRRPYPVTYDQYPKEWTYRYVYGNVTEQAFQEIEESDVRVYRSTGKCDLKSLGQEDNT